MTDSIEWKSDGVVLHLADGRTVKPRLSTHNEGDGNGGLVGSEWMALSVSVIDKCGTYGPEVDDDRAWLDFLEVDE